MPNLSKHPMVELLENNTSSIYNNYKEMLLDNIKNDDFDSTNILPKVEEEEYPWDVRVEITKLVSAFSRIQNILDFLLIPPKNIPLANEKFSQLDWLVYHNSTFIWTIISLGDISLILTSTIFKLGIPPKHCRSGLILDHEFVSKEVKIMLKKLNAEVNKYRESRNSLLHRGDAAYIEGTFKLNLFELLSKIIPDIFQSRAENLYKDNRDSLAKNIEKEGEVFEHLVSDLFDALKPSYEKKYAEIKGELLRKAFSQ